MVTNIKSVTAFMQKIDFSPVFDLTKCGTDFDYSCYLLNDKKVVFEVKKETPNHTVDKIITSTQWQMYRDFFKSDTYLIYATHCCEISNQPISADNLMVKYIELNGKSLKLEKPISVKECLENLNDKKVLTDRYYVKIKYPNGKIEYANRIVKDKKWSSPYYNPKAMNFTSMDTAIQYITRRYEKSFNQKYIYEIWYINNTEEHNKIQELQYKTTIS